MATTHSSPLQTMSTTISQCSDIEPDESTSQVFTAPNKCILPHYNEEEEDGVIYTVSGTHETAPSILAPSPLPESAYFVVNEANIESVTHFLKVTLCKQCSLITRNHVPILHGGFKAEKL
jgi:hypothetical protein